MNRAWSPVRMTRLADSPRTSMRKVPSRARRGSFLGGAATLRSVTTYCGLYLSGTTETDAPTQVVFGIAEQVLARLRRLDAVTPPQTAHAVYVVFDPEALKISSMALLPTRAWT
jgi:hypothetical protein